MVDKTGSCRSKKKRRRRRKEKKIPVVESNPLSSDKSDVEGDLTPLTHAYTYTQTHTDTHIHP